MLAGAGEGRGLGKMKRGKADPAAASACAGRITRASSGPPKALAVRKTPMACVQKKTRERS